ncbi:hypothetical protein EV385_6158 [Krasilnikovia cinnamomea]|uniref:Uncharacterized protein n=1 Tax=Krasilnikovia cinnamomea TaxID=349313 RepID=A0A4Q7ZSP4_9ACTN|nr:hypothetical protein EV385_6158 [Krasilnikovia cinnamomea]
MNREPPPGLSSAVMVPPWRATMRWQMASPSPVPVQPAPAWARWKLSKTDRARVGPHGVEPAQGDLRHRPVGGGRYR